MTIGLAVAHSAVARIAAQTSTTTPDSSSTTSTTVVHVGHLSGYSGWIALLVTAALILLAGLVVLYGRNVLMQKQTSDPGGSGGSLVRSWIAVSLVAGLLLFCAVALSLDDSTLRSTLFGGLISSTGAAVAFYFSSQSGDQARQDIMKVVASTSVPDLVGTPPASRTVADAHAAMSNTSLRLAIDNPQADPGTIVTGQSPAAGTSLTSGSTVNITTH
jgi:hypothetical protein